MRIVVFITVALIVTVAKYDANAQVTANAKPEQEQIAALKRENSQLKEDLAELKEDVGRLKQIHTEDYARTRERQTELADDFKDIKPFAENWRFFLVSIISVSSLWALWTYFKAIPAIAKKEYEARISGLFNEKAEDFHALIGTYDIDKAVKKKYKIVLLSHKDDGFHLKLLRDNGFDVSYHPRIASLSDVDSITSIEPESIVIINDEDAHWTLDEVHQFISGIPNHCFYIGKKQVPIEGDVLHRFAAVSFRAQFIGNLM